MAKPTVLVKRTVFVEQTSDGLFRFADWAQVQHKSLGLMAEPFSPNQRFYPGAGNYKTGAAASATAAKWDATDDITAISTIHMVDSNLIPTIMSGGGPVTIGGNLSPRDGR